MTKWKILNYSTPGYEIDVITINGGAFQGKHDLGLKESKSIDEVNFSNYQLLYLSGGKAPQKLREDKKVLNFVHNFINTNKTIAAICHGSQILISANVSKK